MNLKSRILKYNVNYLKQRPNEIRVETISKN